MDYLLLTELVIFGSCGLVTGYMVFIAGVIQKTLMNINTKEFHTFINLQVNFAEKSIFAITSSLVPFIVGIIYFIFFGFGNIWFSLGIIVYILASIVSKILNLPIYDTLSNIDSSETQELENIRIKLGKTNNIRTLLQFLSFIIMGIGMIFP